LFSSYYSFIAQTGHNVTHSELELKLDYPEENETRKYIHHTYVLLTKMPRVRMIVSTCRPPIDITYRMRLYQRGLAQPP